MSFFDSVTQLPEDPIFQLPILFAADPHPHKVNLGIGSYRDAQGVTFVFPSVTKAEELLATKKVSKDYLAIEGDHQFIDLSLELTLGKDFLSSFSGGIFAAQAIGGTGALRVGGEFLAQETSKTIFIPSPTWPNHEQTFRRAGLNVLHYRYYDEVSHCLEFSGMCCDIAAMPPRSIILLHAGCHNPTGIDPSFEQWQELSALIKKQQLIPFFDFAYQGFIDEPEQDAKAIRYFAMQGHEMLIANSYSKNFGLYGERAGCLSLLMSQKELVQKVRSQIRQLIRSNYSNPPRHGAEIITTILQSHTLKQQWKQELANIRERIKQMRNALISGLQARAPEKDWDFLKRQNGCFSFGGFNPTQVQRLIKEYAIYMPSNGRINVTGLNSSNLDYVIESLLNVIHS